MKAILKELIEELNIVEVEGDITREVTGLCYDSRKCIRGSVFFCLKGTRMDGHEFARQAVDKGASAVVCEHKLKLPENVVQVVVPDARTAMGKMAARFYGHPSKSFLLFGVTGTNGKTTTTFMIESILKAAGHKTGLIGTVSYRIGNMEKPVTHTTPESLELQQLFAEMKEAGVTAAVMEVSSHAIDQNRIAGTDFNVLVFTNLSQDHLDYHVSMEEYARAKSKLFVERPHLPWIVNIDDVLGQELARMGKNVITYGIETREALLRAENIKLGVAGTEFTLITDGRSLPVRIPLAGRFNVYNALAAVGAAIASGVGVEEAVRGVAQTPQVPGRFELVSANSDITVIVDYAHTPDGLEKLLRSVLEIIKPGERLITVFGCGGDRDRDKRPKMGRIAAELSSLTYVTSDNPRSEDPEAIIEEILAGIDEKKMVKVKVEVDRRKAIFDAILEAQPGDVVVIAGKGHETYQEIKGKRIHFDDREVAREALERRQHHIETVS